MASSGALDPSTAPLPVQAVEEMLDFLAHESFRVAGREDQWHPPRMRYRKDVASKLVTKALDGQQALIDRHDAARKEKEAAELGSAAVAAEGTDGAAAAAGASSKAAGRYGATGGTADGNDEAEAAVATLADIATTSGLLDLGVADADPLDGMDVDADVAGVVPGSTPAAANDEDDGGDGVPVAISGGGAFLSSSDDDNDLAGGVDGGAVAEEDRAVAAMRALTAGATATASSGLSKEAAAALAAARRGAAREQMARARAARLDVAGDGVVGSGGAAGDTAAKAPTSMTYDEFMAAGAVGRVPRRGEGLTRALTRDEESSLAEDGYVLSGRKNPVAQKRLEATQRAMHQLQADKRKVELAAESHRRRDQEALESFKRTTNQPAPPPAQPEADGGDGPE